MLFNPDWSKIDDDKIFQRLSNHLFSFECNHTGFTPSSPYIGADGGWDGRWVGTYGGLTGLFSVQAKWTSKNFNEAYDYLSTAVKTEVTKAEKQDVNHLIITTNAELRAEHVGNLEALKGDKLETLQIWHRENLTLKLTRYPFLSHLYFEMPQYPAFIPPEIYFADIEDKLMDAALIGRDNDLEALTEAVKRANNKITIIHASGGYGKSHFVRELSVRLDEECPNGLVLSVLLGTRDLNDAFQDELEAGRNYILVLDDADRSIPDVAKLISFVASHNHVKVVLACRTAGLPLIQDELMVSRIYEKTIAELSDLEDDDLIKILSLASEKETVPKAKHIIQALDKVPYLLVLYGRSIKADLTDEEIDRVNESLADAVLLDASKVLDRSLTRDQQQELLFQLAAIVPFGKSGELIEYLASLAGITGGQLNTAIDALIKGKVLRFVGNTIRFHPDMAGDIYLAKKLSGDSNKTTSLLEIWLPRFPSTILANLGSASPYDKANTIRNVIAQLVGKWVAVASIDSLHTKRAKLEHLKRILPLAPEDSLNLVYAYLEGDLEGFQRDDFGPVVEVLGYLPDYQIEALNLVQKLAESDLDGYYNNYEIKTLAGNLVKPTEKRSQFVEKILNKVIDWCQPENINPIKANIAVIIAKECLASTHEYRESFRNSLTIGERFMPDTPSAHKTRDMAMQIFKLLLDNNNYTNLAIDIAGSIGDSHMHRINYRDVPLVSRIEKDKVTALEEISKLDFDALGTTTLSEIEDYCLQLYLFKAEWAGKATKVLLKLKRNPKYLYIRSFLSHDLVVDNYEEFFKTAPEKDRWGWWVEQNYGDHLSPSALKPEALASALDEEYKTPEEIKQLLQEIYSLVPESQRWADPAVLRFWVDKNPAAFLELVKPENWDDIPQMFKGQIASAIAKHDTDYINRTCLEIQSKLPDIPLNELQDFLSMIIQNKTPLEAVRDCLVDIAKNGALVVRGALIHDLYFYFRDRDDATPYLELASLAVQDDVDGRFIDNLAFTVHTIEKDLIKLSEEQRKSLCSKIEPLVVKIPKLDHDARELMKFCLGKDLQKYLDFIESRMELARDGTSARVGRSEFEVVPYEGLKQIKEAIDSEDDFETLINQIIAWAGDDLPWQFDLRYLMGSITDIKDENNSLRLNAWIDKMLGSGNKEDFEKVLVILELGGHNNLSDDLWLQVLQSGIDFGLFKEVNSLFNSFLFSGFRSIPDSLIELREFCLRLKARTTPGQVHSLLDDGARSMQKQIDDHEKEDESFYNPK